MFVPSQLLPPWHNRVLFMHGDKKERWQELCALAANEQNPEKLLELVSEINKLLAEKEERLRQQQSPNPSLLPEIE
jgi:hypothetical protein